MLKVGVTQKIRPTYRMEEKSLPHLICDVSLLFWSWSPIVHLWSHCGGKLNWDAENAMFRPDLHFV